METITWRRVRSDGSEYCAECRQGKLHLYRQRGRNGCKGQYAYAVESSMHGFVAVGGETLQKNAKRLAIRAYRSLLEEQD